MKEMEFGIVFPPKLDRSYERHLYDAKHSVELDKAIAAIRGFCSSRTLGGDYPWTPFIEIDPECIA